METLLISGPKRSGTHLLYRLFDGHSELFNALAEKYFLEYVETVTDSEVGLLLDQVVEKDCETLFEQIRKRALLPLFDEDADLGEAHGPDQDMHVSIDQEKLRSVFDERRQTTPRTVDGLWTAWFQALQQVTTTDESFSPVVFKCADYGPSARAAADSLEQRKILFIIRNPVFTFSSLRKLRTKQPEQHEFTTLRLIEEISKYRRFNETRQALVGRSDLETHTVRFKDLVANPKPEMEEISDFVGVEFEEQLRRPTFRAGSWKGDSSYDSYDGISQKPLDPERINLSDEEREMIETNLGDVLEEFEYDVYPSRPDELS